MDDMSAAEKEGSSLSVIAEGVGVGGMKDVIDYGIYELEVPPGQFEVLSWPIQDNTHVILDAGVISSQGPDIDFRRVLTQAAEQFRLVIAGNGNLASLLDQLNLKGLNDLVATGRINVVGTDESGSHYQIAEEISAARSECLYVGTDLHKDGLPAIKADMGAVLVGGFSGLSSFIEKTRLNEGAVKFDIGQYLRGVYEPGNVKVVGLCGRNGVGKTTVAERMSEVAEALGIPVSVVSLDSFLKLSRRQRKAWLDEVREVDPAEYERRSNEDTWWDFGLARKALEILKMGDSLQLNGLYNKSDGGEKTGRLEITPSLRGGVVLLEGKAAANLRDIFSELLCITAHANVRIGRLLTREAASLPPADLRERLGLYQQYELRYFRDHRDEIDGVLSNDLEYIRTLPRVVPVL